MSIKVNNVSKFYGSQKALDDVSLEISAGEIVGLLGPNGAGKSTLMKIITCFIPPSQGDVTVYGRNILEHSLDIRKMIGYLPEHNPLYLDMYVKEYLLFIANIHQLPTPSKRVDEMIELTSLGLEQKKKIGALSKGYRQRVGIAQALIHDPKVLILDEPTSGLDPNQLQDIRTLITYVGKEKTVMLSTHIMQEVEAVCQRAIIINQGKVVADDTTANLATIGGAHDAILVEFDREPDRTALSRLHGVSTIKQLKSCTYEILVSSKKDFRADVFEFAVANNLKVLSMQKETRSMEDVFQLLTKKG